MIGGVTRSANGGMTTTEQDIGLPTFAGVL